jgi:chromosome segregation ATPase
VSKRTYGSALNECEAWKDRALKAEEVNVNLLASNGALAGRVEGLEKQLHAANTAAEGLRVALDAGAESSAASAARDEGAQVLALQRELAQAREQIERQNAALEAYERDHQGLLDDLRRLAEQRDEALRTVERLSREGGWTPEGVAS